MNNNRADRIDIRFNGKNKYDLKNNIVKITYENLLETKSKSMLVPGCFYRIIDYVTTTHAPQTTSAFHKFDIIVMAISASSISEDACAIQHDNEEYFAKNNLSAWKIKYCVDNDASRFSWAVPDQYAGFLIGNKLYVAAPMQNIEIDGIRYYAFVCENDVVYSTSEMPDEGVRYYLYQDDYFWGWCMNEGGVFTGKQDRSIEGRGVIYYLKDEFGNEAGYDFKNIQFKVLEDIDILHIKAGTCYYTFSKTDKNGDVLDNSLNDKCRRNVIEECYDESLYRLSLGLNIFHCTPLLPSCSHNHIGFNSRDNLFGGVCHRNRLGVGCYRNILYGSNADNFFGNNCCSNIIGQGCERNIFYNNCSENALGLLCIGNIFMNDCNGKNRNGSYGTITR